MQTQLPSGFRQLVSTFWGNPLKLNRPAKGVSFLPRAHIGLFKRGPRVSSGAWCLKRMMCEENGNGHVRIHDRSPAGLSLEPKLHEHSAMPK